MARIIHHLQAEIERRIDLIGKDAQKHRDYIRNHPDSVLQSVVIRADNVADYLYGEHYKDTWDWVTDVPSIAPPFPNFFIDIRAPKVVKTSEGDWAWNGAEAWGIHFSATPKEQFEEKFGHIYSHQKKALLDEMPENCQWIYTVVTYLYIAKKVWQIPTSAVLGVLPNGQYAGAPFIMMPIGDQNIPDLTGTNLSLEEYGESFRFYMSPAMFALGFINCKNVQLVDNEIPEKLAKSQAKKHGFQPKAYKTIYVQSLQKQSEVKSGHQSGQKLGSFRIRRGHLKDYRDGNGLYGKHHGIYWWEAKIEAGTQVDYSISKIKEDLPDEYQD